MGCPKLNPSLIILLLSVVFGKDYAHRFHFQARKAEDASPLAHVSLTATLRSDNGVVVRTIASSTNMFGEFSLILPDSYQTLRDNCNYTIVFQLPEYRAITLPVFDSDIKPNLDTFLEPLIFVHNRFSGAYLATGRVLLENSVYGRNLSGTTVTLRSGMRNYDGPVESMQKTRDGGSWSKIRPTGYYTATVQRTNYQTESFTVVVVGGNFGGPYFVADFQMLPQVPMTNDDIRVVLRGGRFNVLMQCSPCLQLVVTGPTEGGQELARMEPALSKTNNDSHIFNDFAGLIVQRTVIRKQLTGSYEIMVYDWETRHNLNSSAMKDSNAVVQIYRGNDLWEQFYVPNRDGNTWTVASITGSNVTVINEVTSMIHPTDWEPEHSTLAECAPLSSECENTLGCCGDLTCSNGICAGTPTQAGLEEAPNALDMRTRILAICSDSCEDKLDQPDYYECCRIFMKTKTRLQRI